VCDDYNTLKTVNSSTFLPFFTQKKHPKTIQKMFHFLRFFSNGAVMVPIYDKILREFTPDNTFF